MSKAFIRTDVLNISIICRLLVFRKDSSKCLLYLHQVIREQDFWKTKDFPSKSENLPQHSICFSNCNLTGNIYKYT